MKSIRTKDLFLTLIIFKAISISITFESKFTKHLLLFVRVADSKDSMIQNHFQFVNSFKAYSKISCAHKLKELFNGAFKYNRQSKICTIGSFSNDFMNNLRKNEKIIWNKPYDSNSIFICRDCKENINSDGENQNQIDKTSVGLINSFKSIGNPMLICKNSIELIDYKTKSICQINSLSNKYFPNGIVFEIDGEILYCFGSCFTPNKYKNGWKKIAITSYYGFSYLMNSASVQLDDGRYWILGGYYTPNHSILLSKNRTFSKLTPDLPVYMNFHCIVKLNSTIGVVSGIKHNHQSYLLDLVKFQLTKLNDRIYKTYGCACGSFRNSKSQIEAVYVGGRSSKTHKYVDYVEIFSLQTMSWRLGSHLLPYKPFRAQAVQLNGFFLVTGGFTKHDQVYKFNQDESWTKETSLTLSNKQCEGHLVTYVSPNEYQCDS